MERKTATRGTRPPVSCSGLIKFASIPGGGGTKPGGSTATAAIATTGRYGLTRWRYRKVLKWLKDKATNALSCRHCHKSR